MLASFRRAAHATALTRRRCCGVRARVSIPVASRLAAAALVLLAAPRPSAAQSTPATPLDAVDAAAPLPPLPDLGVDWPTADQPPAPAEPGPDAPEPDSASAAQTAALPADRAIAYRVEAPRLADLRLEGEFRAASALVPHRSADSLSQLELRARADVALIERLLRSVGYFAATAAWTLEPAVEARRPATVRLTFDPGERYRWSEIVVTAPTGEAQRIAERAFAIRAGLPVVAQAAIDAEARVRRALPAAGYPFATVAEPDVVIDHDARRGALTLAVDAGPAADFGQLRLSGEPDLGADHLAVIARFRPGDPYAQGLVEDLRRALIATSLFGEVRVTPVAAGVGPDGRAIADVAVAVSPAPPRTIAGEAGWDSIDGVRGEASWTHRNLLPPEGAVTGRVVLGEREQALTGELVRSNWRRRDQTLSTEVGFARTDTRAFDALSVQGSAFVERRSTQLFQKPWTYALGAFLQASREERVEDIGIERRDFFIAALPGRVSYDASNDLLDPTRGFRASGEVSPELSLRGDFFYVRARIDGSAYHQVRDGLVIAGRTALGAIAGAERDVVPPSRRWYVGGGGSVRGFGFQSVGPRDAQNRPLGGRAFHELSLEARWRLSDTWGVVPFLDAGTLSAGRNPRFQDYRVGAGAGLRFFTSFGPIRIDVATPLNPRAGDERVALYVSIGQAY
jgi:translocation and assembly module TamA